MIKEVDGLDPVVIYRDDDMLVLFKPAYMYVHPPEDRIVRRRVGRHTCIHWLRDHLDVKGYPIHRLDFGTEGLVIFGLNSKMASELNKVMKEQRIKKEYDAIVRGWFKEPHGKIDLPLELDSTGDLVNCLTHYSTFKKIELPVSVNSKFPTSRYSWLDIELKTGRWHQIRRHMNRTAHPILGDREHGDSHHNRFFRDTLGVGGLCLKAKRLAFYHPFTGESLVLHCPITPHWKKIQELFSEGPV